MIESKMDTRTITYHVRRFTPDKDVSPYWQKFDISVEPGMTVLDGLHWIKNNADASLAWRFSCRMGVCGSCGMLLNGVPRLACNTQILHITGRDLTVAPLPNFDIIRDLVPDLGPLFEKHIGILPHILREDEREMMEPTGEFYQSPDDLTAYLQFTYCIKCGLCMAACPTLATDGEYIGPQPLAQSYRYSRDTRDGGFRKRAERVGGKHGIFSCHYAGECSNVCPKGVDPARGIQLMKRKLVLGFLKLHMEKGPSPVLGRPKDAKRNPDIPEPPPFTV